MSRISWGTMRKVLREAEIALGGPNQFYALQKLGKATRYIFTLNGKTSLQPRRFPPTDLEKLKKTVLCLKQTSLPEQKKKEDLSGYLLQARTTVRALQEVTRRL